MTIKSMEDTDFLSTPSPCKNREKMDDSLRIFIECSGWEGRSGGWRLSR